MFPEYSERISRLLSSDRQFEHLFEKHGELDRQISRMQSRREAATDDVIETLKKQKLAIKDRIYDRLRQPEGPEHRSRP